MAFSRREKVGWLAKSELVPQGIGVVLVFVAAGDLQEALAQQEHERMAHRTAAPVANLG